MNITCLKKEVKMIFKLILFVLQKNRYSLINIIGVERNLTKKNPTSTKRNLTFKPILFV